MTYDHLLAQGERLITFLVLRPNPNLPHQRLQISMMMIFHSEPLVIFIAKCHLFF